MEHIPVLLREAIEVLNPHRGECFADGTIGGGGHAREIIERIGSTGTFLGTDRDVQAIKRFQSQFALSKNIHAVHASYAEIPKLVTDLGLPKLDGLILDLGFSSYQIDDPERGMSFLRSGNLDMRYDQTRGFTASDVVNGMQEAELADVIWRYGEERNSRRIAKAIIESRRRERISTTTELAEIISSILPGRGKSHPATKTFQALRILVNGEFDELTKALSAIPSVMAPGGRIAVISFHSSEDRIVKDSFRTMVASGLASLLTKKPIIPSREEVSGNPRSRSAKLRAIIFS